MLCCCVPLHLEGAVTDGLKVCAAVQFVSAIQVSAVTALWLEREAWLGLLCAAVLFVASSNHNYFNCGLYSVLAIIECTVLAEGVRTEPLWGLTAARVLLHAICMRVAFTTYVNLKCIHSAAVQACVQQETRPSEPLLSSYSSITEESK